MPDSKNTNVGFGECFFLPNPHPIRRSSGANSLAKNSQNFA